MRWFLIDKFYDITPFKSLKAKKLLSNNELFYDKHFPWKPIFPPTLMLEMMAQAGGVLAGICHGFKKDVFLGKVEKCEFLRDMVPPRTIEIKADLAAQDDRSAWTEVVLSDEMGVAARSKIMFVFLENMNPGIGNETVVFTDQFLDMFGLREFKTEKVSP